MLAVSCFVAVALAIPSTHPIISCCCFFPLCFILLSTFSLCAQPGSLGYGRDRIMPSKAKAYSFQVCLYRGWVRHRRRGAPHCNAQSLQRVLVMESKTLSAAKLQLFWWLCLLRIIRLVQYRHTHTDVSILFAIAEHMLGIHYEHQLKPRAAFSSVSKTWESKIWFQRSH